MTVLAYLMRIIVDNLKAIEYLRSIPQPWAKGAEVWYTGKGDEDYAIVMGFDPYKDFLFTTDKFEDYSFEVVGETEDIFGRQVSYKNLEVSYKGDLVAVLEHINGSLTVPEISLQGFSVPNRPNALALAAPQNTILK